MRKTNFPNQVEKRRAEATARQEAHDKLSIKQKIAKAKKRRGKSAKEIKRLEEKPDGK